MELTSSAFEHMGELPRLHAYEGRAGSPPLSWSGVPDGTVEFALLADDPDAPVGTFVHWVLCHIPGDWRELPKELPQVQDLDDGLVQGRNDFGKIGYGAPYPPPGDAHRYSFRLYALDTRLDVGSRPTKEGVLAAMEGHVLAEAELVGLYQREL